MKFLIILAVIATALASEKRCRMPCPKILRPICGNDGRTYANECVMRTVACEREEAIIAVRRGRCPDDSADRCSSLCPNDYKPICGSDGHLYSNECALRSSACVSGNAITITRNAKPDGDDCTKCLAACPEIYKPVCAHTGQTFDNECFMRYEACKNKTPIEMLYPGSCK